VTKYNGKHAAAIRHGSVPQFVFLHNGLRFCWKEEGGKVCRQRETVSGGKENGKG
jgi:hypothetical protein